MALDQNIVNLAKAIRQVETGNRQVQGASGELASRYQFMPGTWKSSAGKYLGDANAPLTLENENKVAYLKLKDWKDAGYNPAQIASMWNSGSPDWQGKVGVNSAGVKYNVPAYVDKVYAEYQKQKAANPPVVKQAEQKTIQPTLTSSSPLLDRTSELVSKGFQKYAELPVVKQAGQIVGTGVGILGGGIGGLLGGIAETGRQLYRGIKGEEVDLSQIPKTAKYVGGETAKAGYQMGSGAATMPPFGAIGRIPNLIVGGTQLYEGQKNIREAIKTGDTLLGTQGVVELATGALGAKYGLGKGKRGAIISPKAWNQLKAEAVEVGLAKEPRAKAVEVYKNVLKPSKTEIKNLEIRKGTKIDDIFGFIVDKKAIIEKSDDNRLNTVDAVTKFKDEMSVPAENLNKLLDAQPQIRFNLLETLNKVNKEIDKENIAAFEKLQKKTDAKEILIEEIRARNGNPNVDGRTYNTIKQGMWRMGYNAAKPTANKTARKIGHIIKEDISKIYKDPRIEKLNKELGDYATAIQLLEVAHGRVISGGLIGRVAARGFGALVGASTRVPVLGPIVGERAGAVTAEYLQSPKRLTEKYSKKGSQVLPPSILAKTKTIKPGLNIEDVSRKGGLISKVKPYKETGDLSTKLLKKLEGRTTVSKQFISDLTNSPDLKQVEKDLIRKKLDEYNGEKIIEISKNLNEKGTKELILYRAPAGTGGIDKIGKTNSVFFDLGYGGYGREIAGDWNVPYNKFKVNLKNPLELNTIEEALYSLYENVPKNLLKALKKDEVDYEVIDRALEKRANELGYDSIIFKNREGASGIEVQVIDKDIINEVIKKQKEFNVNNKNTLNLEYLDKVKKLKDDIKSYKSNIDYIEKYFRDEIKNPTFIPSENPKDIFSLYYQKNGLEKAVNELNNLKNKEQVNVQDFANKVKAELLPLVRRTVGENGVNGVGGRAKYESVSLPDNIRGNVANYSEHVYNSPVNTSAGNIHFDSNKDPGYFGHTRIEDMAGKSTRRVIEVQSDLYQKGRLDKELDSNDFERLREATNHEKVGNIKTAQRIRDEVKARQDEVAKLQQYNDPTAHFRMVREEVKQAAKDGKTKLQFPTGETAMKIEGLGYEENNWITNITHESGAGDALVLGHDIKPKVGMEVERNFQDGNMWIITDVLEDGKFKAVPKNAKQEAIEEFNFRQKISEGGDGSKFSDMSKKEQEEYLEEALHFSTEQFDISGKVDTNNPIYKFYEKDLGRYLRNKYNAKTIVDNKGVTWNEVDIKPEWKNKPVEAFGFTTPEALIKGGLLMAGTGLLGTQALKSTPVGVKKEYLGKLPESKDLYKLIGDKKKGISTVYHAEASQTDSTPNTTGFGTNIEFGDVAIGNRKEYDKAKSEFIKTGKDTYIVIPELRTIKTPHGYGVFRVRDTMNFRYNGKNKVDIFIPVKGDDNDKTVRKTPNITYQYIEF